VSREQRVDHQRVVDAGVGESERAVTIADTIRIGRVTRAHGVAGELEVRPDWEHSRGLLEAREVLLESESGEREARAVRSSRRTPKGVLLALEGIVDRDEAEARRGCAVLVRREELPSLADGEYYLCDLIGAQVECPEGPVGLVVEVQMYPSVDALVIEAADGVRFEQPLLDDWIARVEVKARRVVLVSRDGLIETGSKARPPERAGS
jgi:16S rRNA processing protein RimM